MPSSLYGHTFVRMARATLTSAIDLPDVGIDVVGVHGSVIAGVDVAIEDLCGRLQGLPAADRVEIAGRLRRRFDAMRVVALSELAGPDPKAARSAVAGIDGSACGRGDRLADARRSSVVAANPSLGLALVDGSLAVGALDALAKAAGDDRSIPSDLVDDVVGLGPDQAHRVVSAHLRDNATPEDVNDLHDRQHQNRRVRPYNTTAPDGTPLAGLALEGPKAVLDLWFTRLEAMANAAYQGDGGRDRSSDQHVPFMARLFDSAGQLFTGSSDGRAAAGGRADIVITLPLDGSRSPHRAGHGPIPDEVVRGLVGDARIWALLTDMAGQPLWLGRAKRSATLAQRVVLAAVEGGCALCGAPPERCQAHHVMPWEAAGRGPTDIDNLTLACGSCHPDTHRRNHTMVRGPNRRGAWVWSTRPATASETPADGRPP